MSTTYEGNPALVGNIRTPLTIYNAQLADPYTVSQFTTPDNSLANVVAALQVAGVMMNNAQGGAQNNAGTVPLPGPGGDNVAHVDFSHGQAGNYHLLETDVIAGRGPAPIQSYDSVTDGVGRSLVVNAVYNPTTGKWTAQDTTKTSWIITLSSSVDGGGITVGYMPTNQMPGGWTSNQWFELIVTSNAGALFTLTNAFGAGEVGDQTILAIESPSLDEPAVTLSQAGQALTVTLTGVTTQSNVPAAEFTNNNGGAGAHGLQGVATNQGSGVSGNASGSGSGTVGTNTGSGPAAFGNNIGTGPGVQGWSLSAAAVKGVATGSASGWPFEWFPQAFYPTNPNVGATIYYNGATGAGKFTPNNQPITRSAFGLSIYGPEGGWLGADGKAI